MLGLQVLLTSALVGAVASAGYLPEVSDNAAFRYNARRQVTNGTSKSFNGPYSTRGRDIVDSRGEKITWAGVNWPMSGMSLTVHFSHQDSD
jgi:endoglucanase